MRLSWICVALVSALLLAQPVEAKGHRKRTQSSKRVKAKKTKARHRKVRRRRKPRGFVARPVGKLWLSVDPTLVLPIGNMYQQLGLGVGATAALQYSFKPRTLASFRAGAMYFFRKESQVAGAYQIPLLLGLKHYLRPSLFIYPELGLGFAGPAGCASGSEIRCDRVDSGARLAGALALGWEFNPEFNLRGGLYLPDIGNIEEAIGLFLALGWDVWSH